MTTKWQTISLYDLDSGRELAGAERLAKLREYRDTAAMAGVVLVDPTEAKSPEDFDALCEAGPAASEIDWTGLGSDGLKASIEEAFKRSLGMPGTALERDDHWWVVVELADAGPGAQYHRTYEVHSININDYEFVEV